ncbi:MAG: hypothetical protein OSB05_14860 [Akkermansiaceae bacterium]|nr:hypothetical protein [Akkermansiaceae bacterium]
MPTTLQSIYEVFEHQKSDLLLHLLASGSFPTPALVFVRNRETLLALNTEAGLNDLATDTISGSKKVELRERALQDLKKGTLQAIFATESVLSEADLSGIKSIIHFDFHEIDQDYLKRAESELAEITTFVTQGESKNLEELSKLVAGPLAERIAKDFSYDSQPRNFRTQPKKGQSNRTKSKPLQNKKPKLKNKGPRRKTGRTRKR